VKQRKPAGKRAEDEEVRQRSDAGRPMSSNHAQTRLAFIATNANASFVNGTPRNILMLKGHSPGIGDLLRSSAAWRALRDRFPESRLHLWFLSKNPASESNELIARHHLLASFLVSDKRASDTESWRELLRDGRELVQRIRPDLIVDFEPNGFRTSLLSWRLGRWARAATVGIAQVPVRRLFYRHAAASTRAYAKRHAVTVPLEYTERDFVALAALGIERNGTAIELRETEVGRAFRERLRKELAGTNNRPWLGLNIGCGTPDAVHKRPDLALLSRLVAELQRRHGLTAVLTGAPYEQEINRKFLSQARLRDPVIDLAGRTSLLELAGVIAGCRLFVSSDSGPYHMAVALRVPSLALFNRPNPVHYHLHDWVRCRIAHGAESLPEVLEGVEGLLQITPPALTA
jgi:ADP-heptose:LPS heptosyltransferase